MNNAEIINPTLNKPKCDYSLTSEGINHVLANYSKERLTPSIPTDPSSMAKKLYEHAKLGRRFL